MYCFSNKTTLTYCCYGELKLENSQNTGRLHQGIYSKETIFNNKLHVGLLKFEIWW